MIEQYGMPVMWRKKEAPPDLTVEICFQDRDDAPVINKRKVNANIGSIPKQERHKESEYPHTDNTEED